MNEIELIQEVTKSILDGKYIELLDKYENELVNILSRYVTQDIFILLNRIILLHNKNIYNKENDYDKYNNNIHISLKMILSIHIFYNYRVNKIGRERIDDFDVVVKELILKLKELELIYYYYPCKDLNEEIKEENKQFYQNYFKSYFFDLPEIEKKEFHEFLCRNINIAKNAIDDVNFEDSLKIGYIFQNFENLIQHEKRLWEKFYYKIILKRNGIEKFSAYQYFYVYPINLLRSFFNLKGIEYTRFIEKYFFNIKRCSDNSNKKMRFIDCIISDDIHIGMVDERYIFFPRNYYWVYRWFNKVWRSKEIIKSDSAGKTHKSKMHEEEILKILNNAFGEKNVYNNVYLKRKKGEYSEKDFIIIFKNYIISIEAKSKLLPEPCLDIKDGIKELEDKLNESIVYALRQSYEIKEAIKNKKAIFYDSNTRRAEQVLDLNDYKSCDFIQIAITYEEFLNLETNPEGIIKDIKNLDFWVTDVKTLKAILEDTVMKNDGFSFIDYIRKRVKCYGVLSVQSGEELKIYDLYKKMPFFFEKDMRGKKIKINI